MAEMLRQFADEVNGVKEYRKCAERDPEHAQMYEEMARAEVGHAKMLAQALDAEFGKGRTPEEAAECLGELSRGISAMLGEQLSAVERG